MKALEKLLEERNVPKLWDEENELEVIAYCVDLMADCLKKLNEWTFILRTLKNQESRILMEELPSQVDAIRTRLNELTQKNDGSWSFSSTATLLTAVRSTHNALFKLSSFAGKLLAAIAAECEPAFDDPYCERHVDVELLIGDLAEFMAAQNTLKCVPTGAETGRCDIADEKLATA